MRRLVLLYFLMISGVAFGQKISGKIQTDGGLELPFANVTLVKNVNGLPKTIDGVSADIQGNFEFTYSGSFPIVLEVSYLGYKKYGDTLWLPPQHSLIIELESESYMIGREVVITSNKVDRASPIAHTDLDKEDIETMNVGKDVPYVLQQTPSVVSSSDAGAGIGYTAMRIRGIDQASINVTINGIALNDAESQGVYWVDVPDFSSSLSSIQIQRGVGTSTNGPAAFGASVNMLTESFSTDTSVALSISGGSFNTGMARVGFNTGLLGNHWTVNARFSLVHSDGYVQRASTDMSSYFLSTGYRGKKTSVQLIAFGGREETYQAWYGVDSATLQADPSYNFAGALYDANGNIKGFYDNEIDHYQQDHVQLHINHQVNSQWRFQAAGHLTYGRGFFEQYRQNDSLYYYGIKPGELGDPSVGASDVVIRPWLDNVYMGGTFNLSRRSTDLYALELDIGGAANSYHGRHFGRLMWTSLSDGMDLNREFYRNKGLKDEWSAYIKIRKLLVRRIRPFLDLQYRMVRYGIHGTDDYFGQIDLDRWYGFFNPKAGLTVSLDESDFNQIYYSVGASNREPSRNDLLFSPDFSARQEVLVDHEFGFRRYRENFYNLNFFYMYYRDQLVPTGALNDVGEAIRENIGRSFRSGVELAADIFLYATTKEEVMSLLKWKPNATFSVNRNKDYFRENESGQIEKKATAIAYSPELIINNGIVYRPGFRYFDVTFTLMSNYVSTQYLDNNQLSSRRLEAYHVHDLRLDIPMTLNRRFPVNAWIVAYNMLDERYESYGYVYYATPYYFPQAGRHFMAGLTFEF